MAGPPSGPILALHCMLASGGAWRGVAAHLDRPLLRPDLPGHGRAPRPEGDWMEAAVAAAWDAAPEGPVDVVGHSIGGCVALRMLADDPGRIRRLVLVEPVMFAAADPSARAANAAEMAPYGAALARGDRRAALAAFHGMWGDAPLDALPDAAVAYMAERVDLVAATVPAIVDDAGRVLDRLPPDAAPTLVTGAAPRPVMGAIETGLRARMPRMGTVRVAGAGHMAPLTHPEAVAALLRDALA